MHYTKESECPNSYLIWSALSTLSAIVQRRTYTRWVYKVFYPNIYVLLVGPPGITHKGSAIEFSHSLLRKVGASVASQSITKEGLIVQMRARAVDNANALAVMSDEFSSFFDKSGTQMISFLTDIYDCRDGWDDMTKGGGRIVVEAPYLSMFAATTPRWIADNFDHRFTEGGFAARTIFVAETHPRFLKARADITQDMLDAQDDMLEDLAAMQSVEGEYIWTKEAEDWFDDWYETKWPREHVDYRLASYHGRKPTHVIKIAMLAALNESNELELDVRHLKKAYQVLTALERNMTRAYAAVGKNPFAGDLERMAETIQQRGRISRRELVSLNVHEMDRKTIDENLLTLEVMGKLRKELDKGELWYLSTEKK